MEFALEKQSEISAKIWRFILDNFLFGNEPESFSSRDSFLKCGIVDSTGILELIEYLEGTFRIEIREEEMLPENLDSLANVTTFVYRKISKGTGQ
jgi:acyl carrier protein